MRVLSPRPPSEASLRRKHRVSDRDHGRVLVSCRVRSGDLVIVQHPNAHKTLKLNGSSRSYTGDEFTRHEPLVHTPCLFHASPRRVLVLGNPEGAALREVLRWRGVLDICWVDSDPPMAAACRRHLPEMHQGAYGDPRVRVLDATQPASAWSQGHSWDVIILDNPAACTHAVAGYPLELLRLCHRVLRHDGWLAFPVGLLTAGPTAAHGALLQLTRSVFAHVALFGAFVPSAGHVMGFALAGRSPVPRGIELSVIDASLASQVAGSLRATDGISVLGSFFLAKCFRDIPGLFLDMPTIRSSLPHRVAPVET